MEGLVPATATATASTFQLILEHLCAILLLMSEGLRRVPALPVLLSVIPVGALVVVSLMVKGRLMSGSVKVPDKRCPTHDEVCAGRSENTGPMTEAEDTPKPPGVEASPLWLQTLCLKALNEHLSRMSSLQDLADLVRTVRRTRPPRRSRVTHEKPVSRAPGTDGEQLQENMPGDLDKNPHHPESPELHRDEIVGWKQDVQDKEAEKQGLEPSTAPMEQDLQAADEDDQATAAQLWEQKQISEELAAEIRSLRTEKASLRCENTNLKAEIQQLKLKLQVQADSQEDRLTRLHQQVLEAEMRCLEMEKEHYNNWRSMNSTYPLLRTYKEMTQDMSQDLRRSTSYYEKEIRYHQERAQGARKAAEHMERKVQELRRESDRSRQRLATAEPTLQRFPGGPLLPLLPCSPRGPEVPGRPLGHVIGSQEGAGSRSKSSSIQAHPHM